MRLLPSVAAHSPFPAHAHAESAAPSAAPVSRLSAGTHHAGACLRARHPRARRLHRDCRLEAVVLLLDASICDVCCSALGKADGGERGEKGMAMLGVL